jgi:hypothetical protein
MAAAYGHLTSAVARVLRGRRLERVALVLGVCLPVPVCAATGLAVPLPTAVERIAAALVPFADAAVLQANQALERGPGGSITAAPGEKISVSLATASDDETAARPSAASRPRNEGDRDAAPGQRNESPASEETDKDSGSDPVTTTPGTTEPAPTDGSKPDAPRPAPAPTPAPAREEPKTDTRQEPTPPPPPPPPPPPAPPPPPPPPRPIQDTVDQVRETTQPVLQPITDPVNELLPGVGGAVGGLLGPKK